MVQIAVGREVRSYSSDSVTPKPNDGEDPPETPHAGLDPQSLPPPLQTVSDDLAVQRLASIGFLPVSCWRQSRGIDFPLLIPTAARATTATDHGRVCTGTARLTLFLAATAAPYVFMCLAYPAACDRKGGVEEVRVAVTSGRQGVREEEGGRGDGRQESGLSAREGGEVRVWLLCRGRGRERADGWEERQVQGEGLALFSFRSGSSQLCVGIFV